MLGLCKAFEKLFATVPIRANQASDIESVIWNGGPACLAARTCGRMAAVGSNTGCDSSDRRVARRNGAHLGLLP